MRTRSLTGMVSLQQRASAAPNWSWPRWPRSTARHGTIPSAWPPRSPRWWALDEEWWHPIGYRKDDALQRGGTERYEGEGTPHMAMTAMVKDELSRVEVSKTSERKAEVTALLRFSGGLHI